MHSPKCHLDWRQSLPRLQDPRGSVTMHFYEGREEGADRPHPMISNPISFSLVLNVIVNILTTLFVVDWFYGLYSCLIFDLLLLFY